MKPTRQSRVWASDHEAEQIVLAGVLAEPDEFDAINALLVADDFFASEHQRLYDVLCALRDRGECGDRDRVLQELAAGGFEDADNYLTEIAAARLAAPAESTQAYARRVRALSRRRIVEQQLLTYADELHVGTTRVDDVTTRLRTALEVLNGPAGSSRFKLIDDEAIQRLPPVRFLVDGLVPEGTACEMHGAPGCGKSFVALELALDVAAGVPFFGHDVRRAPVVYVAGEGSAGLGARVSAWRGERGVSRRVGVQFMTEPLQLLDPAAVAAFITLLCESGSERPGLIVLDTLARCMVGGDENNAKDMGLAVAAVDRIRREVGAAVLLIHHTRKDGESERGSTALRGAMDAMFSVKADEGRVALVCEKMKDAAPFKTLQLHLIARDDSCVLITANPGWQLPQLGLNENQRTALATLTRDFFAEGASAAQWLAASGIPDRTFYRVIKSLCDQGFVDRVGKPSRYRYVITDTGTKAITANCHDAAN